MPSATAVSLSQLQSADSLRCFFLPTLFKKIYSLRDPDITDFHQTDPHRLNPIQLNVIQMDKRPLSIFTHESISSLLLGECLVQDSASQVSQLKRNNIEYVATAHWNNWLKANQRNRCASFFDE